MFSTLILEAICESRENSPSQNSLVGRCLAVVSKNNFSLEEEVPDAVKKMMIKKIFLDRLEKILHFGMAKASVSSDIPKAVKCHACGSFELQSSLRGPQGLFCSGMCVNNYAFLLEQRDQGETHPLPCIFGETCRCWEYGKIHTTVTYSAADRPRLLRINGPYWPMGGSKSENECIKKRPTIRLTRKNFAFREVQNSPRFGGTLEGVRKKLEFD